MNSATIVQKLWNYCNVLRDDGMSYGDYVEQLTYLLFLKMADERSQPPWAWTLIYRFSPYEIHPHFRWFLAQRTDGLRIENPLTACRRLWPRFWASKACSLGLLERLFIAISPQICWPVYS